MSERPNCVEKLQELEALLGRDTGVLQEKINSTLGCGPDLYFYQKTVSQTKHASPRKIRDVLLDEGFVELLYATLASWGMHSRGAKMKPFEEFSQSIHENVGLFTRLADFYKKNRLNDERNQKEVVKGLLDLFTALDIMNHRKRSKDEAKSKKEASKLVANSKLMHFILPQLVMPIDRTNTVRFFTGCSVPREYYKPRRWNELDENNKSDVRAFFKIHQAVLHWTQGQRISRKLHDLIDDKWNQTVPKVVDNLIILYCKENRDKEGRCKASSSL